MSEGLLFLRKFITHGTKIASFFPSSRWLSAATVSDIRWDTARVIVELGAGTGPITREIVRRARPDTRIIAIERDKDFAAILRSKFSHCPNIEIIEGDCTELAHILSTRDMSRVDHFVSGLPLPSFDENDMETVMGVVANRLAPEGTFNQITEMPLVYRSLYMRFFREVRFIFEPRNFPSGGVYICRHPVLQKDAPYVY